MQEGLCSMKLRWHIKKLNLSKNSSFFICELLFPPKTLKSNTLDQHTSSQLCRTTDSQPPSLWIQEDGSAVKTLAAVSVLRGTPILLTSTAFILTTTGLFQTLA